MAGRGIINDGNFSSPEGDFVGNYFPLPVSKFTQAMTKSSKTALSAFAVGILGTAIFQWYQNRPADQSVVVNPPPVTEQTTLAATATTAPAPDPAAKVIPVKPSISPEELERLTVAAGEVQQEADTGLDDISSLLDFELNDYEKDRLYASLASYADEFEPGMGLQLGDEKYTLNSPVSDDSKEEGTAPHATDVLLEILGEHENRVMEIPLPGDQNAVMTVTEAEYTRATRKAQGLPSKEDAYENWFWNRLYTQASTETKN